MTDDYPLYYDWHGTPIEVEVFDATDEEIDVSGFGGYGDPSHPTGIIPEGETHYLCRPAALDGFGWWATAEKFATHAEPVGPGALDREGEW